MAAMDDNGRQDCEIDEDKNRKQPAHIAGIMDGGAGQNRMEGREGNEAAKIVRAQIGRTV